jgi:hypothetical protein
LNRKLIIFIQIVLVLATLAGSIYVAVTPANSLINWYNVDDAFFYYKVAQNVLAGHGFTFDQINLSNGFHPLWMVVCLSVFWLSRFNLLLPLRVLVLVSGLFNAATSLLLFRFLKRYLHLGAAFAGALFWGIYPGIYNVSTVLGMESAISVFFIVLLLSNAVKYLNRSELEPHGIRNLILLGVIGGLTILARLDNLFIVGVIGIFLLFKIKKIPATVIFDILAITVSIFVSWILRLGSEGVLANKLSIYPMLMLCLLVRPIALYFSGCYLSKKPLKKLQMVIRIALAWGVAFVIEYVTLYVLFKLNITTMFSNSIIVLDAIIGLVTLTIVHLLFFKSTVKAENTPISSFWNWVKTHWKPVLLDGVSYGSPIALLVGSYMIFNRITFGSFTPVSGQIKHWWSTMPNTVYARAVSLLDALGLSTGGGNGPWAILTSKIYQVTELAAKPFSIVKLDILFVVVGAFAIVLFLLLMKAQDGKLARKFFAMLIPAMLIGCIIQITYYFATGYTHTRGWYWMAEMLTVVISGSLVFDGIFSWIDQIKFKVKPSIIVVVLIGISLVTNHINFLTKLAPMNVPEEKQAAYLTEVKALEFYTPQGSKIGMTGGGLVAYFIQDRTIVNLDGLINSMEYFKAMKTGKATQFLDAIPLNYVFGKPYMLLESDPYSSFLKNRLMEIGYIRGNESFTLFKYRILE